MSAPKPGLYVGWLRHRRYAPRRHSFTYPVFLALLDIDRVPELMKRSRLTAHNRWSWATFDDRDHFGDPARPLRERLQRDAAASGVELPDGPIFLLTNLRYLGYSFNPVSFFYCYDRDGALQAILAEVNNTFGESHNYWLTPRTSTGGRRYRTPKVFHVSPFLPLAMDYEFAFSEPGEHLVVHINTNERGQRVLDATLALRWRPWEPSEVRRTLVRFPWMTAKVIVAIHFQALRLFLKRVRYHPHPGTPPSVGHPRRPTEGRLRCSA